jgi:hypothetical protein
MKRRIATLVLMVAWCCLGKECWLPEASAQASRTSGEPARPGKNMHDPLPIRQWDTKSLQALGTIESTRHDTANNQVVWVIQTKKFVHPGKITPIIRDDEGSWLATCPDLEFTVLPRKKGDTMERVQVVLKLPGKEVMKEAWQIRLFKVIQPNYQDFNYRD